MWSRKTEGVLTVKDRVRLLRPQIVSLALNETLEIPLISESLIARISFDLSIGARRNAGAFVWLQGSLTEFLGGEPASLPRFGGSGDNLWPTKEEDAEYERDYSPVDHEPQCAIFVKVLAALCRDALVSFVPTHFSSSSSRQSAEQQEDSRTIGFIPDA